MSKRCNIPTHSHLESTWAKSYSMPCSACGQEVFYHECGHGSKVFFDEPGYPWPKHECDEYKYMKFFEDNPDVAADFKRWLKSQKSNL